MTLRRHQRETAQIGDRIASGEDIHENFDPITPGGGKSALPGILADKLIPCGFADHLLWVAPRDSLRWQAETDFPDWSRYRIRAAGNESDPCRGTQGYVTTYQAIVADPARHLDTLSRGRWILFLDEPHHRLAGGPWDSAIAPLVDRSRLVVYASGTFSRGDGQPIAGLEYDDAGLPIFEGPGRACVRYSRTDALREGAIVPVRFRHLDGQAQWEDKDGAIRAAESLAGGDYASDALFTALRTGYALEVLDETVAHWLTYRREVYPAGKLLVVAPNIDVAGVYLEHLQRRRLDALIATSDDSPAAAAAIARFKGRTLPTVDVLVTVAMAYEGMSVPAVSHIACLTHIRSIPWLEQCFGRGNRTAPGKKEFFVFAPADQRILAAIASIEAEQVLALAPSPEGREAGNDEGYEGGGGGGRPSIRPIGSAAYREGPELDFAALAPRPDGGLGPHAAEKLLRKEIHKHIETWLAGKRPGSKAAYQRIVFAKLKGLVGGKAREDCTTEELTRQYAWLKENARIGGGK